MTFGSVFLIMAATLGPVGTESSVVSNVRERVAYSDATGASRPRVDATGASRPRVDVTGASRPRVDATGASRPQVGTGVNSAGWPESGEMTLAFAAAKKRLGVKLAKKGWRHVHTIELAKDRHLEAWDRGGDELTLMVWRIGTGRTGYSLGITKKARK